MYWVKVTQQLTLFHRYSQLVTNCCYELACSLLKTPFITWDVFCSENLFVNRFVRDERHSWTKVPLYLKIILLCHFVINFVQINELILSVVKLWSCYIIQCVWNIAVRLGYGTQIWLSVSKLKCGVVSLYSVVKNWLKCNTGKVCNCLIKFVHTMVCEKWIQHLV
jgi:hypothetical protein